MKRAVLVVVKGKDFGRSIVVNMGHCVMIGRSQTLVGATGMITQHSAHKLTEDDEKQVMRHLKIRATPQRAGARALLTSFERDMDVGLQDDAVSQRHAMVFVDEAGASLLDMASTNGTFLNGKRTSSAELALGDLVRIGETRIEVRG
jgi:predicted component of type VI protein secretion system